jgi:hypothetical protein
MANTSKESEGKVSAIYSAHRMSVFGGLAAALTWLCYVIYLIVLSAELPDSDETLSVLGVTIVLFALGWLAMRMALYFLARVDRRFLSGPAR